MNQGETGKRMSETATGCNVSQMAQTSAEYETFQEFSEDSARMFTEGWNIQHMVIMKRIVMNAVNTAFGGSGSPQDVIVVVYSNKDTSRRLQ